MFALADLATGAYLTIWSRGVGLSGQSNPQILAKFNGISSYARNSWVFSAETELKPC